MKITVKKLKEALKNVPDDYVVVLYTEGKDKWILVRHPDLADTYIREHELTKLIKP